uniref:Immunoglobulin V-set domain-containing protein n=1 Tax=Rhinolophus ferrumequinum TaxID=59479 RepID=A0A671FXB0_RHIFE
MEPPSAPARRGRVPWQGLLLAVSLLTFWSPLTTAQLALEFMPSNAAEWEDVLFLAHNLPEDLAGYAWFKGGRVDSKRQIASYKIDTGVNNPGPAYSGRETIYPNGSLLFQKVTLEDTGYYTLQAIKTNFHNEEVTGQLRVYRRSGLSDGAIAGIVIGVLAGIALIAALVYFLCMIKSGGVSDQRDLTDHKPSASSHSKESWIPKYSLPSEFVEGISISQPHVGVSPHILLTTKDPAETQPRERLTRPRPGRPK